MIPDGGLGKVFKEVLEGGVLWRGPRGGAMERVREHIHANKKLADKYGLELLAYEAGQHLIRYDPPHTVEDPKVLNLFMSAQKDPRMKQAYEKYLKTWAESGGGLMLHFYGIGEPEPRNFFGMLDHLHQASTPKYLALMDYLGSDYTYTPPAAKTAMVETFVEAEVVPTPQAVMETTTTAAVTDDLVLLASPDGSTGDIPILPMPEEVIPTPSQKVSTAPPVEIVTGITGPGVEGWSFPAENIALSPPIMLQNGTHQQLNVLWRVDNPAQQTGEYFRIYAVDNKGGKKLLFDQPDGDIAMMGNQFQLYQEDISRYLGPPVQFMLQTSPGLQVYVSEVSY